MKKEMKTLQCEECGYIGLMECDGRMGSKKRSCKCPDCGNKQLVQ